MPRTADNWRLSEAEPQRVIPAKEWEKLGWEQFQKLVYDYLCACFGDQAAVTIVETGTGGPDGGRDLELTFNNRYRQWKAYVECKSHRDSLGLETLGKYLVVVLVNRIEELFIFSSSSITGPARAQFAQAAERTRVQLSLVDGHHLDAQLILYPQIVAKYFPHMAQSVSPRQNHGPSLYAAVHVRAFPEIPIDHTEQRRELKVYDDQLYAHLILKNISATPIDILDVKLYNAEPLLAIKPHPEYGNAQRTLRPLQDASIVYSCRVLVPQDKISDVQLIVTFCSGSSPETLCLAFPVLDLSAFSSPPLIGEAAIRFIDKGIESVCKSVEAGGNRLIDIRGKSGVGKSRLLHELSARLRESDFVTLNYDAIRLKDSIFPRLIADLAALPLYKGGLAYAYTQIASLLRARGCAPEYADDIVKFLVRKDVAWSNFYSITECLKHFLAHPIRDKPTAVIIDNVQEVSPTALRLLLLIIDFLCDSESRVCLVLATNTEVMPASIVTPLAEFHECLDSCGEGAFRTRHDVEPLALEDAKLLLYSLLQGANANRRRGIVSGDAIIDMFVKKAGTRPLDLVMAVQWLEETEIVRRRGALSWFIPDFSQFALAVKLVPRGSSALINKRLKAISNYVAPSRWRTIREVLQYLLAFSGRLPASFLSRKSFGPALETLLDHSILRIESDGSSEAFVAFHDNIFRYLKSAREWSTTRRQSSCVLAWLSHQEEAMREELVFVELFNGIHAGRPIDEIVTMGEHAVLLSHGRSPNDVLEAGKLLTDYLDRADLAKKNFDRYFPIKVRYADALLHQAAVTEGLKEFEDLYRYLRIGALKDTSAQDRFYHKFINANLHSAQYRRALNILRERSERPPSDPEYVFLLYDRYGVAYTALGRTRDAQAWLTRALKLAQEYKSSAWESIAHYDLAYVHVHLTFKKEAAIKAFTDSFSAYEVSSERPAWRQIEIYQLLALVALLEGRLEEAVGHTEDALWLSRREDQSYGHVKLLNLLGVCNVMLDNYEAARVAFEHARSKAAMTFNERAFWRSIANLGALSALEDGPHAALDYLSEAEAHLRAALLKEKAFAREIPILTNYLSLCMETGEHDKVERALTVWDDAQLSNFARSFSASTPRRWRSVPGIIKHEGFAFLPT